MDKKKILLLTPSLDMGGMERLTVNTANALAGCGHAVTVMCLGNSDKRMTDLLSDKVRFIDKVAQRRKPINRASLSDLIRFKFRILPFKKWVERHSEKYLHRKLIGEHFDVEIATFIGYAVKIILGSNESTTKIYWVVGEVGAGKDAIQGYSSLEQAEKVYRNIPKVICVTDNISEEFKAHYKRENDVYTINCISNNQHILKSAEEPCELVKNKFTFVSVGRIANRSKGFDRALKAAERLNSDGLDFDFWFVGDGPDLEAMRAYAEEHKMFNVRFVGMKENPYPYIKAADVLVCPSRHEGYGLSVAESMIIGTPVIATNAKGPTEILNYGEFGMVANNEDELYESMKKILLDPEVFAHYQKQTLKRQDYFDSARIVKKMEELF